MGKKSILFIYRKYSTFVKNDFEILSSNFQVDQYQFHPTKGILDTIGELLKQFFYLLIHIWKYDAVYIWFADYFSLLPVLFAKCLRKKSFVVIGGYDVCRIKKLRYGALYTKFRGFFAIRSMQWCTVNITVSKHIDRKVKFIAPGSNRMQIYNCANLVIADQNEKRENIALTVGNIDTEETIYVKGLDTFVEVATIMPDYHFLLIGFNKTGLGHVNLNIPGNMHIYDKVPNDELAAYYAKARFYCQFSRSESFGIAIVESMMNGCIPVVTNEGGMPEIVGDQRYIVKRSPETIRKNMLELENDSTTEQQKRKERTLSLFSFDERKDKLTRLVLDYIGR